MRERPIRQRSGLRPKKSLGQHFLNDLGIIQKIIALSKFGSNDLVLEIGPGKGALTLPLARAVGQVFAIEKDDRLIDWLNKRLIRGSISNVTLINEDILKWDFGDIQPFISDKIGVIGNLPYNISTPFLAQLMENRAYITRAVLMFQLEIGKRLTAGPGTKAYGAMSVLVQYHARTRGLLEVSSESFFPKPNVDSMVLEVDFDKPHPGRAVDEIDFIKVVKGAFLHRRKTLLNSLKLNFPFLESGTVIKAMEECDINPGVRAEKLTIDKFVCLASVLTRDAHRFLLLK